VPGDVCVPTGPFTDQRVGLDVCSDGHPLICRWDWCRKPIAYAWIPEAKDWGKQAQDGSWGCSPPVPGGGSVYDLLNRLTDGNHMEDYSTLKAAVVLGFNPFAYRPHLSYAGHGCGVDTDHTPPPVPPYCCGMPMWLTGDGWRCRVNRNTLVGFSD
jgi:hypothetical protein